MNTTEKQKSIALRAGNSQPTPKQDVPTLILFYKQRELNGNSPATIKRLKQALNNISNHCNINNPYEVKEFLANAKWKNSTKVTVIEFYNSYLKFINKTWEKPKYTIEETLPFIPTETELTALINNANRKYTAYLKILLETGIRTDELHKLKWIDLDLNRRTINITPSKGSNPRILPISQELTGILNALKPKSEKLCTMNKHTFRATFEEIRKRTATKLNNPRILKIHLHTFRAYKGTMEYHLTKDIIHVKQILGHKNIKSTMKYINIERHSSKTPPT